ncbi:potassium voltage-gated channel subfamily C member 3-like isoform X3 [Actinia tenebrosa]|nr:potassium voltage-gated channel subfamily C member 3-like isoform X3 [Actinia tenebrosa]XP_031555534.1 potassium voltage-gated channel subfamily C member 3-like isoform X3 [Actinia tenebrosa]XP_031555535.1 potassium voltage-gated channel subfamily C member 3-like isoform X3 [Actinia tenebrosa]XP_031555536.1 potassium voltage-gated channel subfamily C member 3-like isoform X3 [Actinia tenebrosa]XP_031555537.1 potassium voltage-gated channel subfamily C member 3-like isoform X3 [Actinia tenebr
MPNSRNKKHKSSSKIILNVGGTRHETYISTLRNIPDTRLYNLCEHHKGITKAAEFDSSNNEYFFDRHPGVFAHILNYYRTGKLHCPYDICGPMFEEELEFWGIDEQQVETCCWEVYKQHKEKQEKLKYFKLPGFDEKLENNVAIAKDCEEPDEGGFVSWWSRLQPKVWRILEEPHSSQTAKVAGIISFVLFALYIIKFSLSTLKRFEDTESPSYLALYIIHVICLAWFTVDLLLRIIFTPDKLSFFTSICTCIDIISLVPLYVSMFAVKEEWLLRLEMLVMMKVVRIFQLFKLSYVMQVLVNTLKASLRELCVLLVIMAFQTAVFSSILYFIEKNEKRTEFGSVPETMWWAIITMTTVGYGDVSPQTWMGKIVGSACAIFGVLVIALPVSVVASNFSIFYTYAKARLNVPRKTRRVALSHAITSMQIPRGAANTSINNASFSSERRYTQRTLNASEMSFNFNSNHGSLANSDRSHSNSLQSLSMREPQCGPQATKSLNSLPYDLSYGSNFQASDNDDKSQFLGAPGFRKATSEQFLSTTSSDRAHSQNPFLDLTHNQKDSGNDNMRRTNIIFSQISLNICPTYPLYHRRGAVTPASMSIKSNSSNSSYGNVFKGTHLGVGRPIIFLSGNSLSVQNLRSVQNLIPDKACSCASISSHTHVHSADDTTAITPLLCNVEPCIVSTQSLNNNSTPKLVKSDGNIYSNGPIIAISSPSDENINKLGITKVDQYSQTDLTCEPPCLNDVTCDPQLKSCISDGPSNQNNNHVTSNKQLHLVPNPLHDFTFPRRSKTVDEVRHLRRSTTL